MAEISATIHGLPDQIDALQSNASRHSSSTSLHELWLVLGRRRLFVMTVVGGLLLSCLLYCLIAPKVYEASARIALRGAPAHALNLDGMDSAISGSFASGQIQLETLANVFRSDQLAWRVISSQKLYQAPAFMGSFARRFPNFDPEAPGPDAQAYLLDRFQRRLTVQTLPRTLVLQIRFRSKSPALSAAVVNGPISAHSQQERDTRVEDTTKATAWLNVQLSQLKSRVQLDDHKLMDFQRKHGIMNAPGTGANGQPGALEHTSALLEIDELSKQLADATTERMLREAEYRAASTGDPELVLAADPRLQMNGGFANALLQQLHTRRSDLEQEQTQLRIEHGPNFPRIVEIRTQMQDIDLQIKSESAKLTERFRSTWKTAVDHEALVRRSLDERTAEGMKLNEAATEYAVMRQEADSNHQLYMRMLEKAEEGGAGCWDSQFRHLPGGRCARAGEAIFSGPAFVYGHHSFRRSLAGCGRCAHVGIDSSPCETRHYVDACPDVLRCCRTCAGTHAQHVRTAYRCRANSTIYGDEGSTERQRGADGLEYRARREPGRCSAGYGVFGRHADACSHWSGGPFGDR